MSEEACCPRCGEWSAVEWDRDVPPGGLWWVDSACCPKCDQPVFVESECDFREVSDE